MSEFEAGALDKTLARHSAPALLGIKCANLISLSEREETVRDYIAAFRERAGVSGLRIRLLCKCRGRCLVYVYHEGLLRARLESPEIRAFLLPYGYHGDLSPEACLSLLASRMTCGSFPHEIGVFLGYPLADIEGFIRNEGKNCLLCGCWKVYSDPEQARRTFQSYGKCRDALCDQLEQGLSLSQALHHFKEEFV